MTIFRILKSRGQWAWIVLLFFTVMPFSANGNSNGTESKGAPFTIGGFIQASPLQYGLATGLFKRNLDMRFTTVDSAAAGFPLMVTGDLAGITNVSLTPLPIGITKGLKIKIIWMDFVQPDAFVVNSDIRSAADLKGKKIGTVIGSTSDYTLDRYLAAQDLSGGDVTTVNLPSESISSAFKTGQIDGAFIWPPHWNKMMEAGGHVLARSGEDGAPKDFQVYIVSESFAKKHSSELQKFICDTAEAQNKILHDYDAATKIIAKQIDIPVEAVRVTLPQSAIIPPKDVASRDWLGGLAKNIRKVAEWEKKRRQIDYVPTLDEIKSHIDDSFAKKVAMGKCR